MRFGIREICDVVLRAKATQMLGARKFYKNEPVLYFDTLKTSSLEGASTTVYATGGRGNTRLVAWEGERTLTFTMEDALISPESFAILSGAGLLDVNKSAPIFVHQTSQVQLDADNTIVLPESACWNKYDTEDPEYNTAADIFVMVLNDNGEIDQEPCIPAKVADDHKTLTCYGHEGKITKGSIVLVDYYVKRTGGAQLIEITADKFGGNYYLEASTLFRRESDGVDMPAEFIIPNCKVQSNFTFSMASSGDPSTFTFTMDAFPDYTKFDRTHKVLAALQVITDVSGEDEGHREPCSPVEPLDYETGTVSYGGKAVKDLYEDDVKLTLAAPENNKSGVKRIVTGTFKPIDEGDWNELPTSSWQDNELDNSAFYVVQIPDTYKGHKLTIGTKAKSDDATPYENKVNSATIGDQELFWVLNVTKKPTIKFEIDGEIVIELDFSNITIAEA